MPANTTTLPVDLVRRLHCAAGHIEGITRMVEHGADCEQLVRQTLAVQAALREVNRLILNYHLNECLAQCLEDSDQVVREQASAEVVALYQLLHA